MGIHSYGSTCSSPRMWKRWLYFRNRQFQTSNIRNLEFRMECHRGYLSIHSQHPGKTRNASGLVGNVLATIRPIGVGFGTHSAWWNHVAAVLSRSARLGLANRRITKKTLGQIVANLKNTRDPKCPSMRAYLQHRRRRTPIPCFLWCLRGQIWSRRSI